jgi:hypothetical protein
LFWRPQRPCWLIHAVAAERTKTADDHARLPQRVLKAGESSMSMVGFGRAPNKPAGVRHAGITSQAQSNWEELEENVPGSNGLPGSESGEGDRSMPRKPVVGSRWTGPRTREARIIWRKLDCLNPNLQRTEGFRPPESRLKPAPYPCTDLTLWSVHG